MAEENNLNDDLKDKAKEFTEEAKESASEFSKSAKETFTGSNKKILAGVLAILLGALGIHKFILGYNKEGIIYLTKSDEEFYNTYQVGKKAWF
jgi:hypothetical protein